MTPQQTFRSFVLRGKPLAEPIEFSFAAPSAVWSALYFSGEKYVICMN